MLLSCSSTVNFSTRTTIPFNKVHYQWAVVVAQLVEWLLLIPEVCGSYPVRDKKLCTY